jgi:hypothetical protein
LKIEEIYENIYVQHIRVAYILIGNQVIGVFNRGHEKAYNVRQLRQNKKKKKTKNSDEKCL